MLLHQYHAGGYTVQSQHEEWCCTLRKKHAWMGNSEEEFAMLDKFVDLSFKQGGLGLHVGLESALEHLP